MDIVNRETLYWTLYFGTGSEEQKAAVVARNGYTNSLDKLDYYRVLTRGEIYYRYGHDRLLADFIFKNPNEKVTINNIGSLFAVKLLVNTYGPYNLIPVNDYSRYFRKLCYEGHPHVFDYLTDFINNSDLYTELILICINNKRLFHLRILLRKKQQLYSGLQISKQNFHPVIVRILIKFGILASNC